MKHGKKYVEAAKLVDRAVAYEPAEAVALVRRPRLLNLMKQSKFTSEQDVTDVMQISRSVAQLFFRTEQVKK